MGREKLIAATLDSVSRRGMHGTAVAEVLSAASVPSGVLYHHYPEGKADLVEAAVTFEGAALLAELDTALSAGVLWREVVCGLIKMWSVRLQESNFQVGCPVTATAAGLEDAGSLQKACADAYSSWVDRLAAAIQADGIDAQSARRKALATVAVAEGALLLAKALRTTEPLEAVVEQFRDLG